MIVIGIIGLLAMIAIPAFMNFLLRSRAAEAPLHLKALTDAEVAYFNRPRTLLELGVTRESHCFLVVNGVPAQTPSRRKNAWVGIEASEALGFSLTGGTYFFFTARPVNIINGANTPNSAKCFVNAGVTTGWRANPAHVGLPILYAMAHGNLDGDAIPFAFNTVATLAASGGLNQMGLTSLFYRPLSFLQGPGGFSPVAGPMVVRSELE